MLADRTQETGAAFPRALPEHLRRTIERACPEMDEGFVRALEAAVPWAAIVIERFHVARASRDGADMVRRRSSSGSRAHGPQPRTPNFRGRWGRFASGLGISHRRSGSGAAGLHRLAADRGSLPPAGRPDGTVRTRRHAGGGQARDPGLVQAGASERAGRGHERSRDDRAVAGEITHDFQVGKPAGLSRASTTASRCSRGVATGSSTSEGSSHGSRSTGLATTSSVLPDLTPPRGQPREFREGQNFSTTSNSDLGHYPPPSAP